MRRYRPFALAVWMLCGTAVAAPGDAEVIAQALEFVQKARGTAGGPPLKRREDLDRVAAARARTLHVRPAPSDPNPGLEREGELRGLLEAENVGAFGTAYEYFDIRRGHTRGQAFARWWRSQPEAWSQAMDPEVDSIGLATARTDDHWLILVAVLLDEAESAEVSSLADRALERINVFRIDQGLSPLSLDVSLAKLLASRSELDNQELLASVEGVREKAFLGARYRGPGDAVEYAVGLWSREPLRARLLDPVFTRAAVGVTQDAGGEIRFVLLLIQPFE